MSPAHTPNGLLDPSPSSLSQFSPKLFPTVVLLQKNPMPGEIARNLNCWMGVWGARARLSWLDTASNSASCCFSSPRPRLLDPRWRRSHSRRTIGFLRPGSLSPQACTGLLRGPRGQTSRTFSFVFPPWPISWPWLDALAILRWTHPAPDPRLDWLPGCVCRVLQEKKLPVWR